MAPPLIERHIAQSRALEDLLANSKYVVLEVLKANDLLALASGLRATASKSHAELRRLFDRPSPS